MFNNAAKLDELDERLSRGVMGNVKAIKWAKRKIRKLIPESIRIGLFRRFFKLPTGINELDVRVKIAETQDELEQAYKLLHDSFVKSKLMEAHPSGLRCNLYLASPYTTTIIAVMKGEVVGTMSFIKDSPIGLSSDKTFKKENDFYRALGHKMIEASALAVHSKFHRNGHVISLLLMKYLFIYVTKYMDCNTICCTIRPHVHDFYKALWGFQQNGKITKHAYVESMSIHMSAHYDERWAYEMRAGYSDLPDKNAITFLFQPDKRLEYPDHKLGRVIDPVMTPETLEYFFVQKTDVFKNLEPHELKVLYEAYSLWYDVSGVPYLNEGVNSVVRPFRLLTSISAVANSKSKMYIGKIQDLSVKGLFLACDERNLNVQLGEDFEIIFDLGPYHFKLKAKMCWQSRGTQKSKGLAFEFLEESAKIKKVLKMCHSHFDESESDLPGNVIPITKKAS